jgi:hypothetical protein
MWTKMRTIIAGSGRCGRWHTPPLPSPPPLYFLPPLSLWSPSPLSPNSLAREYWMIYRNQMSRGRMIRLLAYPLPPLLSTTCLSFSVFACVAGRAYCIIRRRESLALYKSFNTLCVSAPRSCTQRRYMYILQQHLIPSPFHKKFTGNRHWLIW